MIKKLLTSIVISLMLVMTVNVGTTAAVNVQTVTNTNISTNTQSELKEIKEKQSNEMQDYIEKYGSDAYGVTAYILDKVRIYSIPICFIGIALGAIYQYVIGIRKMDVRDRGFGVVIAFVTLLIICQILPLIFAIVVRGWRG